MGCPLGLWGCFSPKELRTITVSIHHMLWANLKNSAICFSVPGLLSLETHIASMLEVHFPSRRLDSRMKIGRPHQDWVDLPPSFVFCSVWVIPSLRWFPENFEAIQNVLEGSFWRSPSLPPSLTVSSHALCEQRCAEVFDVWLVELKDYLRNEISVIGDWRGGTKGCPAVREVDVAGARAHTSHTSTQSVAFLNSGSLAAPPVVCWSFPLILVSWG